MHVLAAESTEQFAQFRDLVAEYEASLPPDLRHFGVLASPIGAFIAVVDTRPCGCVAMTERGPSTAVMERLYVQPAYRGHGAARALIAALIARARERGYTRVALDTDRRRLATAYQLYRSLGFVECAPYGEVTYACPTFMELPL
jgi:GNAT superfamily N-acetyltransferase